jgi:hypothetical protein
MVGDHGARALVEPGLPAPGPPGGAVPTVRRAPGAAGPMGRGVPMRRGRVGVVVRRARLLPAS